MSTSGMPPIIKYIKRTLLLVLGVLAGLSVPFVLKAQPIGATISNPIVMNTYGQGTFNYVDTKDNSPVNGYQNNMGQASDDIYYKFIVQGATNVTISHCGSGINDSYMHLLDVNGLLIELDDDDCGSLKAIITRSIPAGTYFIVSEGWNTNAGFITTNVTLVVQAPPGPVVYEYPFYQPLI